MTTATAKRTRRTSTESKAEAATVSLPMGEPAGYIASESGHIDVRLDAAGVASFRRFHAGLLRDGAKLSDGRPVSSKADAVRWLFGQLRSEESEGGSAVSA